MTAAPGVDPVRPRCPERDPDAATLVLLGLRSDPGDEQAWDRSWGNRAEVHQATGMVVAQLRISAADALARLRSRVRRAAASR
jgi:hypothetical protein